VKVELRAMTKSQRIWLKAVMKAEDSERWPF